MKRFLWVPPILIVFLFGFISWITLRDYGWNWDESQHMIRGQAYLRVLTGKTNFSPYQGRESIYEKNTFDLTWLTRVIGHPPTTDIILASVNQVLYKRLAILPDMESYHVYGIAITFIAAIVIGLWSYQISGWFGGVISVLAYYGFPLLFSEQHFNFKDPAIMAYNTIFLYLFWLGVTKKQNLFLVAASIVGGVSLGTKFNILFLAPVILLWLFWYAQGRIVRYLRLLWIPVVMVLILWATYPFLWKDFLPNLRSLIDYYRQVGGNRCPYMPMTGLWFWRCIDVQTVRLFLTTIPIPTIMLSAIGMGVALTTAGKNKFAPLLWFLALTGVIIRVILPVNSLYGGSLRQVLEFIGPTAMLAGLGAAWFVRKVSQPFAFIVLALCYIPVFWNIWSLHPDENLYTNTLQHMFWQKDTAVFINGIVSYGNAYKDGIAWINANAEPGASVSLVIGLDSAIPVSVFRSDIRYGLKYFSGYEARGEYLMELVNPEGHQTQLFPYKYVSNVLIPVYEKRVAGYPTVRVWKNDSAHTKPEFRGRINVPILEKTITADEINLKFLHDTKLQMLSVATSDAACRIAMQNAYVLVSADGRSYDRMYEPLGDANMYPFAGEEAIAVKLFTYKPESCDLSRVRVSVVGFQ